jgi:hypothetical protein
LGGGLALPRKIVEYEHWLKKKAKLSIVGL